MDLFDVLLNVGLVTGALVAYLIVSRRSSPSRLKGNYREPTWNFQLRLISARRAVRKWKKTLPKVTLEEGPRTDLKEGWDCVTIRASSPDGDTALLSIRKLYGQPNLSEVTVYVKLADGTEYKLPQHPETLVSVWENIPDGWKAGGLKIQVLEKETFLRILYNGLLTRESDGTKQHVRFNFTWASATAVLRQPADWSNELAARALALEPWRDDNWPSILAKHGENSWLQFGAVQGRFEAYDAQGLVERSEYLELRGVRERAWSPKGYQGLRRSITLTAAAKDGTAVYLRGFSYKDVLTVGFTGCVRFPDCSIKSITSTDLAMSEFFEHPDSILDAYNFNVSSNDRTLSLSLRFLPGAEVLSGAPHAQRLRFRALGVGIDLEQGTGVLELGYEVTGTTTPVSFAPAPRLRWLSEKEAGPVKYCVSFDERGAACPTLVGGKGASLALLASVQHEQGYRVPPGYCITVNAFEKQLEANPFIEEAIKEIELANANYDEKIFKQKCERVVHMINGTKIVKEVQDEIFEHLEKLRQTALKQNFGPDLRFAVRSSAVGEDSEALSAAGQNESVLGCADAAAVVRALMRCWGSMYAFTSAYYRRQNGQEYRCGGAVVVQVMAAARAAGVMFTRHPQRGDPSRLLITANYGLGETVVSGSVEPDTIIVSRGSELTISKIELGSKLECILPDGDGVTATAVSEQDRLTPCIAMTDALELARIGVAQDELWGAPRDIEWAFVKDELFLLQARPITSLERWSDEELLHELDFPIMADDELTTFANTGEVMPKPLTALTYDLVYKPLTKGISECIMFSPKDGYDPSTVLTHNRAALCLYNSMYRSAPKESDLATRVLEVAIHGHTVADARILAVAQHRRPHSRWQTVAMAMDAVKFLWIAKAKMNDTIKIVKEMSFDEKTEDPQKILEDVVGAYEVLRRSCMNHSITTSASVFAQLIAMSVLVEGAKDFTPEQSTEMSALLSSGDVLSAEVPSALAKLATAIEESGKAEEFRAVEPKGAMDWLAANLPKVHKDTCAFLETHGHRAIMEFDLATKPWVLVPEEMMQVLQQMRGGSGGKSSSKTDAEIISSLKSPKKSSTRRVLGWLLPLCRHTVQQREVTKAHVILGIHNVRVALRRLAVLLTRRWFLPNVELIFHFRLRELRDYLQTRDPALLRKASQRQQYHPSWCKLRFAELNTGWVRPLRPAERAAAAGGPRLQAMAACGGTVVARACVVNDLAEIGSLRHGDVLITHSTDIGWSPYFPLLAGIVTELGGLISHGAVIAREYGLPCIVGAVDATEIFSTGDTVRLTADLGLIERVTLIDEDSDQVKSAEDQAEVNDSDQTKPDVEETKPVEQIKPATDQIKPAVDQSKPAVDQTIPAVDQTKPVDKIKPAVDQIKPAVEKTIPAVVQTKTVDQIKPAVDQTIPAVDQTKPVDQIKPAVDQNIHLL